MISGLCLTTNAERDFGYPFIESIKSFLPVVDEMIVVDGGSTDKTIEMINAIGDKKIRIIQDDDVRWEKNWSYWRMDYNLNRGLKECNGNLIVRFDVDCVLHEDAYKNQQFKDICDEIVAKNKFLGSFQRLNFPLIDRYHTKKPRSLVINKGLCDKLNLQVAFGLNRSGSGLDSEPIFENSKNWVEENKMLIGKKFSKQDILIMDIKIFSYSYSFSTKEQLINARIVRLNADIKQENMIYKTIPQFHSMFLADEFKINPIQTAYKLWSERTINAFKDPLSVIPLETHPKIIQDKIKNMTIKQQGYNCFGLTETAKYFI